VRAPAGFSIAAAPLRRWRLRACGDLDLRIVRRSSAQRWLPFRVIVYWSGGRFNKLGPHLHSDLHGTPPSTPNGCPTALAGAVLARCGLLGVGVDDDQSRLRRAQIMPYVRVHPDDER
jgi:hypothetical protein